MNIRFRRVNRILIAAASLALFAVAVQAKPASSWRIKFNHETHNDGSIVLRIAPEGAEPIDVETKVPANTTENSVAKLVRDSLRVSLGKGYHVETDDGEDVLIKRKGKTPKFEVTMVNMSLTGLEVKIK